MLMAQWLTRSRLLIITFGLAIALGGACNCDDDPDPDPDDVGVNDVEDDVDDNDVDDDNDVEDDVDDNDVDIPEGMARIQVVHEAADPGADGIDVYLDDELTIEDFEFRTATPFLDVDAETYDIAIAPGDSESADDAVATFEDISLEDGERYLVVASGVLDTDEFDANPDGIDIELALYILDNAREVADDEGFDEVVLFHGATDAPAVDVEVDDQVLVDALAYGNFTDGYLSLPPGNTMFDLVVSDTGDTIATYETPSLEGGDTWVGVASGFLDDDQNPDAPFEVVIYPTPVDGERLDATILEVVDDDDDDDD